MAIDLYSDNSGGSTTSPRLSFSYDLSQSDTVPVEQILRSFSSSSSVDFNFCVHETSDHNHASMADELFSNGKIIPTQIRSKTGKIASPIPPKSENLKPSPQSMIPKPPAEDEEVKRQDSKSFWGFKRSSSCGNGYARSLCPITLLSRSHSTGSSTSSKRSSSSSSSSSASASKEGLNSKSNRNSQKPPLRKSGYGYGINGATSNGIRVNPVLNLGFGSFFSTNNKNKNKK